VAGVRAPRRLTPWIDNALLAREGLALVCPADNSGCIDPVAC